MMSEVVGFLGIVAAVVFVWAYSRHQALRTRQMQHEERMTALQKGLEIPPAAPGVEGPLAAANGARRVWFRLTVLGLALVSFSGGIGLLLAFRLVDEPDFSSMWAMGLIPIMVSVGLFLFWLAVGRELRRLDGPSE
jgi:hypothetical protein